MRIWAFWRRVEYLSGLGAVLLLFGTLIYYQFFHQAPSCFDGAQNGNEAAIDCGGSCTRICNFQVSPLRIGGVKAFRVREGQYNAIAYIENQNRGAGIPSLRYVFNLSDSNGTILERSGTTVMPPDGTYAIFEGDLQTGARIPTKATITLGDNDAVWLPSSIGRKQFTVRTHQLSRADSLPVLTAPITNTLVQEVKKVDVIATIFDSEGTPLTSSATYIDRLGGKETQNLVFTWPEPIAKTLKSCEVPTDVVLAIDLSGSMNDDGGTPPEPVTSVLNAASAFISRLKAADGVGIVTFATHAALKNLLSTDKQSAMSNVRALTILPAEETGSTDTGDAIKLAADELSSSRHNPDARKVLVLLSDGLANAPGKYPEGYATSAAAVLKAKNVDIYTIGLGSKVNDVFMAEIASDARHYLKAPNAAAVDGIYKKVTSAICENGPARVDIIPKTSSSFAPFP